MGDRLRKARETAGLDQAELAELMGISRASVTNAEKGHHGVRKIVLNAWALATGVPVSWLETGVEGEPEDPRPKVRHQGLEPRTRCLSVVPDLSVSPAQDGWSHGYAA
jgi:transcriptional regulator with XRE-family HTH domain